MVDRLEIRPEPAIGGQAPLNVPLIKQEQTWWCWAACAQMVMRYYGNDLAAQCDFANWAFGQTNCCSTGDSVDCNKGLARSRVKEVFGHWGIESNTTLAEV